MPNSLSLLVEELQPFDAIVTARRRHEVEHHVERCPLDQHAGRLAARRIAHDDAVARVRRVLGDAGELQAEAVHDRDVTAAPQVDRMIGRRRIELLPHRQAAFGELVLVPAAAAHDPIALLHRRGTRGEGRLHIGDRARLGERYGKLVIAAIHRVHMAVMQAGDDRAAFQLDDPRLRSDERLHRRVVADRNDAIAADRQRRDDAEAIVDGKDLAACENEIGLDHGAAHSPASCTILPPTMVISARMFGSASSGTVRKSSDNTARSAYLRGSSEPMRSSMKALAALPMV